MKIIAHVKGDRFLAEVSESEIQKHFNTRYADRSKKIDVDIGVEIDLGQGYDFHRDIKHALQRTHSFIEAHQPTVKALMEGVTLLSSMAEQLESKNEEMI